jgi:Outer membrane protein beta-barrel domain
MGQSRGIRRLWPALLPFLALAAVTAPLEAQGVSFGIKAGVNLANFYGDAVGNTEIRPAAIGGVFLDFRATPTFSFQLEGLYAQKGARETETVFDAGGQPVTGSVDWKYDYIDVPALLRFHIPTGGGVRPSLYLGPVVSFLVKAKVEGIDIKDYAKSTDVGGTVGGTLELGAGGMRLLLDVRYTMGLEEFDTSGAEQVFSRKHNTISGMVGFAFGGR